MRRTPELDFPFYSFFYFFFPNHTVVVVILGQSNKKSPKGSQLCLQWQYKTLVAFLTFQFLHYFLFPYYSLQFPYFLYDTDLPVSFFFFGRYNLPQYSVLLRKYNFSHFSFIHPYLRLDRNLNKI